MVAAAYATTYTARAHRPYYRRNLSAALRRVRSARQLRGPPARAPAAVRRAIAAMRVWRARGGSAIGFSGAGRERGRRPGADAELSRGVETVMNPPPERDRARVAARASNAEQPLCLHGGRAGALPGVAPRLRRAGHLREVNRESSLGSLLNLGLRSFTTGGRARGCIGRYKRLHGCRPCPDVEVLSDELTAMERIVDCSRAVSFMFGNSGGSIL